MLTTKQFEIKGGAAVLLEQTYDWGHARVCCRKYYPDRKPPGSLL
jgi:hypothetical protein